MSAPTNYTIPYPAGVAESLDDMLDAIGADCHRIDIVKDGVTTTLYDTYGIEDCHSAEYEATQPARDAMIDDHTVITKQNPDQIIVWMFGSNGWKYIATRAADGHYELSCLASEVHIARNKIYRLVRSDFKKTPDGCLPHSHPYPLEGASVHNVLPYVNTNMWALITVKAGKREVQFNGFEMHDEMKWCLNCCAPGYGAKDLPDKYKRDRANYAKFITKPDALLDYDEFTLYTTPIPDRTFNHTYHCKKLATVDQYGNTNWQVSVALH